MSRPMEGLKVLDFTHVLAGPFATRVLGDMGADVVKINSAERAAGANSPEHPYYIMWNRNKRSLALNMSDEAARDTCRALCEQADIVIDNFSVGILDRWGVGYEAVRVVNPGVIYMQMSGMGTGGPWSKYVTYAPTIHALSGLTHMTGVPGREDLGIGYSYNDHLAGLHGTYALLAALEARQRRGHGQHIDMSQFEVGANFLGPSLLDYRINDHAVRPAGNKPPYDAIAPHGCYPCLPQSDKPVVGERWIAIVCEDDEQWRTLVSIMGNPSWAGDEKWSSTQSRYEHLEELDRLIGQWTADKDASELMMTLQHAGVPAGLVQDGVDLAEKDPQLAGADFLKLIEDIDPEIGVTWADRLPIHFERTPCDTYNRVRQVGEDNTAILSDWLGMTKEEVQAGEESGKFT